VNKSAPTVFYGLTLIIVLLVMPRGAAGLVAALRQSSRRYVTDPWGAYRRESRNG
jgi:hypothetical protein